MKIEDSPYQFNGTSPAEKLRRNIHPNSFEASLDELDLTFLELLTSVASDAPGSVAATQKAQFQKTAEEKASAADAEKASTAQPKLNLVGRVSASPETEDINSQVEHDMALLKEELTAVDVQYMKQAVIPGLPILVGSVSFESIFPLTENKEISYRGFEISPKLAELIEKGYKTGRPIRVELDPNSAVVLKIRNGQVSAEFVSTDKSAAFVMQQELDDLRNRMAARNLPVGTLEYKYRDSNQSGQNPHRDESNEHSENER